LSPQAKYNREVRTDPLIREIQNKRRNELNRAKRNLMFETEIQCWIYQLELDDQLNGGMDEA